MTHDDIIEHIADCLVSDHAALLAENKRLRDALEERDLDYNLLAEQYRELLNDLEAIRGMAREDIIRIAEGSGLSLGNSFAWSNLERFSAIVAAAKEQQMIARGWRHCAQGQRTTQFCGLTEQAIAAEREACIKLVWNTPLADDEYVCHKDTIAAAIRARGDA